MEISDLRIFCAAAQEGSVTRAAQILNYTQSNVTTRIQALESELQTTLFYRHSRGITLTPAGETLLKYTRKIFQLVDETRKAVQYSPVPRGPLAIGSMETTAAVRLPALLSRYHQRYPDVDLTLVTGPTEQHVNMVLEYALDGAFVAGPVEHPELLQEPFIEEELVLVTDSSHPPVRSPKDLRKRTILVFRPGCSYRAKLEQWLHGEGILPVKIMEFGTLEAILGCVRAGLGVTLLPKSAAGNKSGSDTVRCHPVPPEYGKVTTVFIRRKDVFMTGALERFLELAREHAKASPQ